MAADCAGAHLPLTPPVRQPGVRPRRVPSGWTVKVKFLHTRRQLIPAKLQRKLANPRTLWYVGWLRDGRREAGAFGSDTGRQAWMWWAETPWSELHPAHQSCKLAVVCLAPTPRGSTGQFCT